MGTRKVGRTVLATAILAATLVAGALQAPSAGRHGAIVGGSRGGNAIIHHVAIVGGSRGGNTYRGARA